MRDGRSSVLATAIPGHAVLRIASNASAALVGIYLAHLAVRQAGISAELLGALGAVSFASELIFSIPLGMASDAVSPRWLMPAGALLGGLAIQLFTVSRQIPIFYLSRALEGIGVAAVTPPLLAWLAEATAGHAKLRARAMSFFELSLLAGLALGGMMGSQFWQYFQIHAFSWVAGVYLASALLLYTGAEGSRSHGRKAAIVGVLRVFRDPAARSLAPVWLCVNAVVGLWLGPTLPFLLTHRHQSSQYLDGIFSAAPADVGWLQLGYAAVFGAGITVWSFALPRIRLRSAMRIALLALLPVCLGLWIVNHSAGMKPDLRWAVTTFTALLVMVESGFTPAALAWLAGTLRSGSGKGAAMGIYSVLLSLGAIGGSLLAGELGQAWQMDGLLLGTVAVGIAGLGLLEAVPQHALQESEES
ncbi:MAG TPA: MFS transporter [Acidobacteriaceae bacterium]|nr:MFS transporter [Acidobacteriaceae bacterium]